MRIRVGYEMTYDLPQPTLFGHLPPGWAVVDAINEYVHHHIRFGYEYASPTKTAWDAYQERAGVCRGHPLSPPPPRDQGILAAPRGRFLDHERVWVTCGR